MTTAEIQFEILSYWHAGSGSGQGADLDALVIKSAAGLPYLPGKTVKGLCRDAVTTLEELDKVSGVTAKWFGSAKTRYESESGKLRFTNATIVGLDESWALANRAATRALFTDLAATKIDDKGLAVNKSLRKIEVAIPLTLIARIEADADVTGWVETLKQATPLIRSLGSHRRRGLGRVKVSITEVTV